jgi:hypothetical protein
MELYSPLRHFLAVSPLKSIPNTKIIPTCGRYHRDEVWRQLAEANDSNLRLAANAETLAIHVFMDGSSMSTCCTLVAKCAANSQRLTSPIA